MKLILAPLRGLTEAPFRNAFSRHFSGVDAAVAPFIATMHCERLKPAHMRDVLPARQLMPVMPQLLSNSAADFLALAHELYSLDYRVVNWNLGCPYPMVAKKKRGSGLLLYPDLIARFLKAVMSELPLKLSVKLRLGWENPAEIEALIPILNSYDLDSVIIHPRLGVQMYGGQADVAAFVAVAAKIRHKVVYNGDINNMATFLHIKNQIPAVTDFMLGRYLVVNPFLAETLRGAELNEAEMQRRFSAFYADLFQFWQELIPTPAHLMQRMKAYWNYFAAGFADCGDAIKKIQRAQTMAGFRQYTETFLQNQPRREPAPHMTVK